MLLVSLLLISLAHASSNAAFNPLVDVYGVHERAYEHTVKACGDDVDCVSKNTGVPPAALKRANDIMSFAIDDHDKRALLAIDWCYWTCSASACCNARPLCEQCKQRCPADKVKNCVKCCP